MLEFKETVYEDCVNVIDLEKDSFVTQLLKIDGKWGSQAFVFRLENTDHLRQIAGKLDELNKGKV